MGHCKAVLGSVERVEGLGGAIYIKLQQWGDAALLRRDRNAKFQQVLHPSLKLDYFRAAQWEPSWIATARTLAEDMWKLLYKKVAVPQHPSSESSSSGASRAT